MRVEAPGCRWRGRLRFPAISPERDPCLWSIFHEGYGRCRGFPCLPDRGVASRWRSRRSVARSSEKLDVTDRHQTTSHEIERYAGLFAARTRQMRSSAMRDRMAITARPEVISFAGGLPDTSTFPPSTVASITQLIAVESCASALQYGPTEGFDETKRCIAEVMAEEGMRADPEDLLVTTGGQQVIDLVAKTFVDPGDVVICEAPTYPGAVP